MLTLTYYPAQSGTIPAGLVLCNTSRSLAELDVKFNHSRQNSIEHLAAALGAGTAALGQDLANWRHVFTLRARRDKNFSGTAFPDEAAGLLFALDQPASFVGPGTLKIELTGPTTSATRYLLNCLVDAIALDEWLGVAPSFQYTFNGGLITSTSPFT